ncbi:hypothetical protein KDU71_09030 [Carboxylicivirga sediminis]|uniref:LPP20 lipoprotein n=1 Tax=Carboxylicivirga sediminis TaxID=2006564 RepID=A0A941F493_9BACT|nr:hypothetical protein [Carboxylicivirga sediminis]MBR8535699.1 hypothetical protein [Carboxylicivirga sediminis]
MNTKRFFGVALLTLSIVVGLNSCKSKEKVSTNNEVGTILEDMPCEDAGRSDKKFFRASAMATSSDLSLAEEKALLNAKQRLVTLISSNTKSVTDRYVNEREFGDAAEFEQKFENLTREVADETINNIVVACQKKSVLPNGKYRGFIAVEVSKDDVLNGINNKISQNQKLQVDYDKAKFEEIFNQEMQKMAEERGF